MEQSEFDKNICEINAMIELIASKYSPSPIEIAAGLDPKNKITDPLSLISIASTMIRKSNEAQLAQASETLSSVAPADMFKEVNKEAFALDPPEVVGFDEKEDYRVIVFRGTEYHLGDMLRRIIKELHRVSKTAFKTKSQEQLMELLGTETPIRKLFKGSAAGRKLWKKLVIVRPNGRYELNIPSR